MALGHDLGKGGPRNDGVDGDYGPKTEGALFKELEPATAAPTSTSSRPITPAGGEIIIPPRYEWLRQVDGIPLLIHEGLRLFGTLETPGTKNNPVIMAWAREVGLERIYTADSIPWCGLYVAVVVKRAAKIGVKDPLWALNWGNFGEKVLQPGLGDVLTFLRDGGGHVGFYVGEDKGTAANKYQDAAYHVLGGNQSDAVTVTRILKKRLKAARRPFYRNKPLGVRPYVVAATGALSTNEA